MNDSKQPARTKQELIIAVWEELDCESVGTIELREIQKRIGERFGPGAIESPASIARLLADEGAVLRHPEVLRCDTEWRESQLSRSWPLDDFLFSTLAEAEESIRKLESWRREVTSVEPKSTLPRELGWSLKSRVELISRSKIVTDEVREVSREVIEWLVVWLQDAELFEDWLSLRKRSRDFRERFPE